LKIVADPAIAEAMAALHAVMFAKEMGFSQVLFKGDALTIVKAINSTVPVIACVVTLWRM
jgi:ribonuclease HI